MNAAYGLREMGKHKEAIQYYINAMKLAREDWRAGIKEEHWQKKVIFMACNGMGISYSKWGRQTDALENFADAFSCAPNDEARSVAKTNLDNLQKALKEKTGVKFTSHFIE